MKIEQIDKNFAAKAINDGREKDYYSIPDERFSLFGLRYSEKEGDFIAFPATLPKKRAPEWLRLREIRRAADFVFQQIPNICRFRLRTSTCANLRTCRLPARAAFRCWKKPTAVTFFLQCCARGSTTKKLLRKLRSAWRKNARLRIVFPSLQRR